MRRTPDFSHPGIASFGSHGGCIIADRGSAPEAVKSPSSRGPGRHHTHGVNTRFESRRGRHIRADLVRSTSISRPATGSLISGQALAQRPAPSRSSPGIRSIPPPADPHATKEEHFPVCRKQLDAGQVEQVTTGSSRPAPHRFQPCSVPSKCRFARSRLIFRAAGGCSAAKTDIPVRKI